MEIVIGKPQILLIDPEDMDIFYAYEWHPVYRGQTSYAVASTRENGKQKVLFLHRLIMRALPSQRVDHIDRNGLNNQRSNLRFVTARQNVQNQGPSRGRRFKGVDRLKNCKTERWRARITIDGKDFTLGIFSSEEEAAHCYNIAAKNNFGEFACLNVI